MFRKKVSAILHTENSEQETLAILVFRKWHLVGMVR